LALKGLRDRYFLTSSSLRILDAVDAEAVGFASCFMGFLSLFRISSLTFERIAFESAAVLLLFDALPPGSSAALRLPLEVDAAIAANGSRLGSDRSLDTTVGSLSGSSRSESLLESASESSIRKNRLSQSFSLVTFLLREIST
jgi:hypothetical protein